MAIREEIEGFKLRAAQDYLSLLEPGSVPEPVFDEAFRGTLRLAIDDFNAGLFDRATGTFERLLVLDPTCLKANYALQLADLRSFRKGRLEDEVASFIAVYRCLQSIEKNVVIAAAHRRIADLDYRRSRHRSSGRRNARRDRAMKALRKLYSGPARSVILASAALASVTYCILVASAPPEPVPEPFSMSDATSWITTQATQQSCGCFRLGSFPPGQGRQRLDQRGF